MVRAGLVAALLVSLAGCGGGGGGDDRTADVTVKDNTLRYEPSKLEIDLNREETFTFLNNDDTVHNVTIPALSTDREGNAIDVDIPPDQRVAVKVPAVAQAPRDGFFLFYCKYHQTEGMSGRLKVSS